jgi:hypothetical protein
MKLLVIASGPTGDASGELAGAGLQAAPAGEGWVDAMSRTAVPVGDPDWGTFVSAPGRPESGDFNFGLLAALAACAAFWVSVALTVYWVI